jgi:hypothetical protein
MPDYLQYHKSVSSELISIKDRVRNFIDDHHWGEDGRYKEAILRNVLIRQLPKNVSIGTGFVIGESNKISSQIDIIIYSDAVPPMFEIDNFIIAAKESVLGIIEVKTNIRNCDFCKIIKKAHNNGILIGNKIFNGVFGFDAELTMDKDMLNYTIDANLRKHIGYVNNISFGKDIFMKYWQKGQPNGDSRNHYSFYGLNDLSFGYFISNLVEYTQNQLTGRHISDIVYSYLYPIEGTKEMRRIDAYEIIL